MLPDFVSNPAHPSCSRFDLLHIMVDEPDDVVDNRIGMHIIATHMHAQADEGDSLPQIDVPPYTKEQMQLYIKYIRCISPEISAAVSDNHEQHQSHIFLNFLF